MFPQLNRWQRLPSLTRGQEAGARVSTKGTSPPPSGTQRRTVMTEGYTEGRPRKPSENTLGLISGKKSSTNGAVFPSEARSEEHTSELQSRGHLVCRLLL